MKKKTLKKGFIIKDDVVTEVKVLEATPVGTYTVSYETEEVYGVMEVEDVWKTKKEAQSELDNATKAYIEDRVEELGKLPEIIVDTLETTQKAFNDQADGITSIVDQQNAINVKLSEKIQEVVDEYNQVVWKHNITKNLTLINLIGLIILVTVLSS